MSERSPILGYVCTGCNRSHSYKLNKKACADCQQKYCDLCSVPRAGGGYQCRRCELFNSRIMERRQLEELTEMELRSYFVRSNLALPGQCSKTELTESILQHQAGVLMQLAHKAQQMLRNPVLNGVPAVPTSSVRASASTSVAEEPMELSVRENFDPTTVLDLDDLHAEGEISVLPVRQLKLILQRNCIDYKNCIEKKELQTRVRMLWKSRLKEREMESKISHSGDDAAENAFMCKICWDAPVDCVLLECGHMLTCVKCGRQLHECPVCRHLISRVVHAFRV